MSLNPEALRRINHWRKTLHCHFYTPLAEIPFKGFVTNKHLTLQAAKTNILQQIDPGTRWGSKWQYGWFFGTFTLPSEAECHHIVLQVDVGGEGLVFIDNKATFYIEWTQAFEGEELLYINGSPEIPRDWPYKDVPLTSSAAAGQCYELAIEAYAGHGRVHVGGGPVSYGTVLMPEPEAEQTSVGRTSFGIWNEDAYQLWLDVETLFQIREYSDPNSLRVSQIDKALQEFSFVADFELPVDQMNETLREARNLLAPLLDCHNGSTAPTIYAIGHAHLDVAWLWPLAETDRKIGRTIANQLTLMNEYPEYKYIQSQPYLLKRLQQNYPDLYQRMKDASKSGQLFVEGGMWIEADTNIPSGESLIRQFIHGKRFFSEEFDVDSELLWLPDVFGYSGALPQIMKGCSINYFATHKIFWTYNGGDPFPYNLFMWEGIDGSAVLTHIFNDYNSQTDPRTLTQRWNERAQKNDISSIIVSFGWGDAGGGPTRDHLEFLKRTADLEGVPRTRIASPIEYFHDVEEQGVPNARYVGELYFQAHRGTYTSQAKTKKKNRASEFALRDAEFWSVMAMGLLQRAYPYDELQDAWQKILLLQFHDILPGCSIRRVHEEAEELYDSVQSVAESIAESAYTSLIKEAGTLTILNSLSWQRNVLVSLPEGCSGATDIEGTALPVQLMKDDTLVEVTVPSCGWTSITLNNNSKPVNTIASSLAATVDSLENEYLGIQVNDLGEITTIYDKESQTELTAGICNSLKMYKDVPNWFDAWDIDSNYEFMPIKLEEPATINVVMKGPLSTALCVTRKIHNSTLSQKIILHRQSRQVIFATHIDWQEDHKLLKVAFPVNIHANNAIHEIQFGHIHRPNHRSRPFDESRFEVCNHKWTALAEENRGVAILNDSKYGVNVLGNSINLTLLRSPLAPDMTADRGTQNFTYAVYAWNGGFANNGIVQKAYELNVPVKTIKGFIGHQPLLSVSESNIIIDTVKAAEDRSGDFIIRLYESKRTTTKCKLTINLPVQKAFEANMLETDLRPLSLHGQDLILNFRPFEIKTLRLSLKPNESAN